MRQCSPTLMLSIVVIFGTIAPARYTHSGLNGQQHLAIGVSGGQLAVLCAMSTIFSRLLETKFKQSMLRHI